MKADKNDESNKKQIVITVKWKEESKNKEPADLSFNIDLEFEQATQIAADNPSVPDISGPSISEYPKVYNASSEYPESYIVTINSATDLNFLGMTSAYKIGNKVTINKEGYPSGEYYKVIASFNPEVGEEEWLLVHENGNHLIGFMSSDFLQSFIKENSDNDMGILFTAQ